METKLDKIGLDDLIAKFDPFIHPTIRRMAEREGNSHLVVFENLQMDSSRFGELSCLAIGPAWTYKTLADIEGQHLGDLPSERKYPVSYCETKPA